MKIRFPSFGPNSYLLPRNKADRNGYLFFCLAVAAVLYVTIAFGSSLGILDFSFIAQIPQRDLQLIPSLIFGFLLLIFGIFVFLPFSLLTAFIAKPIWFGIFNFFKRRDWGDRKAALVAAWPAVIVGNLSFFAMFWLLEAVGLQHSLNELGPSLIRISLPLSLIVAPFAAIGNFR